MSKLTATIARGRMDAAREDTARQLLAWEAVAAAIGDAAGKGHGLALFAPPIGGSIKTTTSATELVEKLTATGFRCAWRERRDPGDVLTYVLEVSWDAPGTGG